MSQQSENILATRDYILARTRIRPQIAVILGSGLGALADDVQVDAAFPYNQIPGFPVSTVAGHAGQLVLGKLMGKPVVVMQGRFHFYEGYPMARIAFPIRVMHALGADTLIVTNAAGGLNPEFDPGDVMLIIDHINVMGDNPLVGPNDEAIGPRFPDMSRTYTPDLRQLALDIAQNKAIPLRQGVYVATSGPTYETPAERRYLRMIGGDAVGMSTVPEATVAAHAGMAVLGISAITNKATGNPDQQPDSHAEVLEMAQVAGQKLVRLAQNVIEAIPARDDAAPVVPVAIDINDPTEIAGIIDHTLLRPDALAQQISQLCQEAVQYNFASVCVNPTYVSHAAEQLKDSDVKVCTVIGFPLGAVTTRDKIHETGQAIKNGATEVDMVINIGALKEGNDDLVKQDIAGVVQAAHGSNALCKVIIETALLTDDEKIRACRLARQVGADFVKTSTGFSRGGATPEDVALMRRTVGPNIGVKASGGIKTLADAQKMIAAGANRIGVSSGVQIIQEARSSSNVNN